MTYIFDPKLLRIPGIEEILASKSKVSIAPHSETTTFLLRPLRSDDKDYIRLLEQLTSVGFISDVQLEVRCQQMIACKNTYFIIVIENEQTKQIIGCATLLIELKIIHQLSKRGHIEDVVVDVENRGEGLGKLLVSVLIEIGRAQGCYKISLDCDEDKIAFYERNGFKQETHSMCIRLN